MDFGIDPDLSSWAGRMVGVELSNGKILVATLRSVGPTGIALTTSKDPQEIHCLPWASVATVRIRFADGKIEDIRQSNEFEQRSRL